MSQISRTLVLLFSLTLIGSFVAAFPRYELQEDDTIYDEEHYGDERNVALPVNPTEVPEQDEDIDQSPDNRYDFIKIFAGLYYQNTYKQINDYLVDHLESDDSKLNLQLALDWLNEEKRKPNLFHKHFIGGLTQFTNLLKVKNRCDGVSYAILLKNDRATNHATHKSIRPANLRRIESVVYQVSLAHAIDCLHIYPESYRQRVATLDKGILNQVELFVSDIRSHILFKQSKFAANSNVPETIEATGNIKSIRDSKVDKVLYQLLRHLAQDDPDRRYLGKVTNEKTGKFEVNKAKVERLYDRYFAEPCQYYVDQLGPDVFVPAAYDIIMLQPEDRYSPADESVHDFLLGWFRYRICKLIVSKERASLLNDLIKLGNKN